MIVRSFVLFFAFQYIRVLLGEEIRTQYICDGSEQSLSCPASSTIIILLASYGRFSLSICNIQTTHSARSDCTDPVEATEMLRTLCDYKEECKVIMHEHSGTHCTDRKMNLEVQYKVRVRFMIQSIDFQT